MRLSEGKGISSSQSITHIPTQNETSSSYKTKYSLNSSKSWISIHSLSEPPSIEPPSHLIVLPIENDEVPWIFQRVD